MDSDNQQETQQDKISLASSETDQKSDLTIDFEASRHQNQYSDPSKNYLSDINRYKQQVYQRLQNILKGQGIEIYTPQLISNLLQKKNSSHILKIIEEEAAPKNYKKLLKIIQGPQFQNVIKQYQVSIKKIKQQYETIKKSKKIIQPKQNIIKENKNEIQIIKQQSFKQLHQLFQRLNIKNITFDQLIKTLIQGESSQKQLTKIQEEVSPILFRKIKQLMNSSQVTKILQTLTPNQEINKQVKIKKIFQAYQVQIDLTQLINNIAKNISYKQIFQHLSQNNPPKIMAKVKKAMASSQMYEYINFVQARDDNIKLKASQYFIQNGININEVKDLIESISNILEFKRIFNQMMDNIAPAKMRKIKQIVKSEKFQQLFVKQKDDRQTQKIRSKIKQDLQKIFKSKINISQNKYIITLIQQTLNFNSTVQTINQMKENVSPKIFKATIEILESSDVKKNLNQWEAVMNTKKQYSLYQVIKKQIQSILLKVKIQQSEKLNQLIDCLINQKSYQNILNQLGEFTPPKLMKDLKAQLNSKQLKQVLNKLKPINQVNRLNSKNQLNSYFSNLRIKTLQVESFVEFITINNGTIGAVKKYLEENVAPNQLSKIFKALQSNQFKDLIQKMLQAEKQQKSKLINIQILQLFSNKNINVDLTQLIQTIVNNKQIRMILEKIKQQIPPNQFKTISQIINSKSFRQIISKINKLATSHKKEIQQTQFKQIQQQFYNNGVKNVNLNKLINSMMQLKPLDQILQQMKQQNTPNMMKIVQRTLKSEQLRNIIKKIQKINISHQQQKAKINMISLLQNQQINNINNINAQGLINSILQSNQINLVIEALKQKVTPMMFSKIIKVIESQQFQKLITSFKFSQLRRQITKQLSIIKTQFSFMELIEAMMLEENVEQILLTIKQHLIPRDFNLVKKIIQKYEDKFLAKSNMSLQNAINEKLLTLLQSNKIIDKTCIENLPLYSLNRLKCYVIEQNKEETSKLIQQIKSQKNKTNFILKIGNFENQSKLQIKFKQIICFIGNMFLNVQIVDETEQFKKMQKIYQKQRQRWDLLGQFDFLEYTIDYWQNKQKQNSNNLKILNIIKNVNILLKNAIIYIGQQVLRVLQLKLGQVTEKLPTKLRQKVQGNESINIILKNANGDSFLGQTKSILYQFNKIKNEYIYIKEILGRLIPQNINEKIIKLNQLIQQSNTSWKLLEDQSNAKISISLSTNLTNIISLLLSYILKRESKLIMKNNREDLQKFMIPIQYQNQIYTNIFLQKLDKNCIFSKLRKISNLSFYLEQSLCIFIQNIDQKLILLKQNQINVKKIIIMKKQNVHLKMKGKFYQISISKLTQKQDLKYIIKRKIKEMLVSQKQEDEFDFCIFAVLQDNKSYQITQKLNILQKRQGKKTQYLQIIRKLKINIFYESQFYQESIYQNQKCIQLKKLIQKKFQIPPDSQVLRIFQTQNQNWIQRQNQQNFSTFQNNIIDMKLICKLSLEYYGFNKNFEIQYNDFRDYFIQEESEWQKLLNSCKLTQQYQQGFFSSIIKFMFAALKKKFGLDYIIEQIRSRVFKKTNQIIWGGKLQNFNKSFVYYYMLMKSDEHLKIQLINITKSNMPIPLVLRKFNKISQLENNWFWNSELIWFLNDCFTITSIGIHNQGQIDLEKGKSQLLNKLCYTKFQTSNKKHPITFGCPQIMLNFLQQKAHLNIIDVPSHTPWQFTQKIIGSSDFLIIHSWKNAEDTKKIIQDWQNKYGLTKFICLLRDKQFQDNMLKLKSNEVIDFVTLKNISNLPTTQTIFIKQLSVWVWKKISQIFQKAKNKKFTLDQHFKSNIYQQFRHTTKNIESNIRNLTIISPIMLEIKIQQKVKSQQSLKKIKCLKQKITKLHPQIGKLTQFLNKHKQHSEIILLRFRQDLKFMREKAQSPYQIIYKTKQFLGKVTNLTPRILAELAERQNVINGLQKIPKIKITHDTINENMKQLHNAYDVLVNEIKPQFFSIQLFWRELQYLLLVHQKYQIPNTQQSLLDLLIQIRKKQIQMNQPIEVLDGDLLQMPRAILSKLFEFKNDRVAVITVFGPQSSGKSTLLNFLFGCDFGVSAGRCTKGAYGTYFKFSTKKFRHCDGIFIIDTEGLFAQLSKRQEKNNIRKQFDAKLVLFCLTVSDFVIINTKGNVDSLTTKILNTSLDRFDTLAEQNITIPQFYLILNQNNSTDVQTSQSDIHKLQKYLPPQNAYSLTQAYQLQSLDSKKVMLLKPGQEVIKRISRESFLTKCMEIIQSIMKNIQKKNNFRDISTVIKDMELKWNTIDSFPNLGINESMEVTEIKKKIKNWTIEQVQYLNNYKKQVFEKIKQQAILEKDAYKQIQTKKQLLIEEFVDNFELKQFTENQQMQIKIQLQKNRTVKAFQNVVNQLKYQIKDLIIEKGVKKSKQQGNDKIQQLIRMTKIQQQKQNLELNKQQKQKRFNQVYNLLLEQIKLKISVQTQLITYFERAKEIYENFMKLSNNQISVGTRAGLPNSQWTLDLTSNYQNFSKNMRINIFTKFNVDNFIEYKQNRQITKAINKKKQGKFDAKFQYFDMSKYFDPKSTKIYLKIQNNALLNSLKHQIVQNQINTKINQFKHGGIYQSFDILNHILYNKVGIKIVQIHNFQEVLKQKMNWWSSSLTSNSSLNVQKKHVRYNAQSLCYQEYNQQTRAWQKLSTSQYQYQNQFFGKGELTKLIKDSTRYYKYTISQLGKKVTKIIKWNQIQKYIEQSKQFQNLKNKINSIFLSKLNQDLSKINLKIDCQDIYQIIMEQKKQKSKNIYWISNKSSQQKQNSFKISMLQTNPSKIQNIKCFQLTLGNLRYFNAENLIQKISKESQFYPYSTQFVYLGYLLEDIMEVNPNFSQHTILKTYLQNNTHQFFTTLKLPKLKQFVVEQLKQIKSFQRLFMKIDKIVSSYNDLLTSKTIHSIFVDVSREITAFNDDLNQVSYKLCLYFNGYAHLYTVYMIWKSTAEALVKQKNKPYEDMANQKTRLDQFNYYDSKTSRDKQKQIEGEVKQFINKFQMCLSQNIQAFKKSQIQNYTKIYLKSYNRQYIQSEVDQKVFKREHFANKQQQKQKQLLIYKYLEHPNKLIEQQYSNKRRSQLINLENAFKLDKTAKSIVNQLQQFLILFKQKFDSSRYSKQSQLEDYLIFTAKSNQASFLNQDIQYEAGKYVFQALMDIILSNSYKKYAETDYELTLNTNKFDFKLERKPTPSFQSVISKMKMHNLTISNPYEFINMILQSNKLMQDISSQNKMIEVTILKKQKNAIQQLYNFIQNSLKLSIKDKSQFQKGIFVKICHQKCPCCQRICAVQQPHDSGHMCLYGHQMRALGGIKYENGQASVVRCEFLQFSAPIKYNEKDMTWQQFKQYWESKKPGSWNFKEDLKNKEKNNDLFELAWELAGQQFCKKNQMKFVKYNKMADQIKTNTPAPIHYIFALDDSGSMKRNTSSGKTRWEDLMAAFNNTINDIKQIKGSQQAIRITVLIQGSSCIINQQNVSPSKLNLVINPRMSQNNFLDTFTKAHFLIEKYVKTSIVKFIFMTDGGDSYPSQPVHQIKLLQNLHPKKIEYYGIQFCGGVKIMQDIKNQLKGQNTITHTVEQLTNVYREIIKRKQ